MDCQFRPLPRSFSQEYNSNSQDRLHCLIPTTKATLPHSFNAASMRGASMHRRSCSDGILLYNKRKKIEDPSGGARVDDASVDLNRSESVYYTPTLGNDVQAFSPVQAEAILVPPSNQHKFEMISSFVFLPQPNQPFCLSIVNATLSRKQSVIALLPQAVAQPINRFLNDNPVHLPIKLSLEVGDGFCKEWIFKTDSSGFVRGFLDFSGLAPKKYSLEIFSIQDDGNPIGHLGSCEITLLLKEDAECSVIIPDLDNTCWHTPGIPLQPDKLSPLAGFRNLKEVTWCPGMQELFVLLGQQQKHYVQVVTGSPIALQGNITEVFLDERFPQLGGVSTKLIREHGVSGMAKSFSYKTFEILRGLLHYPDKAKLLFMGDDGQQDPQVYALLLGFLKGRVTQEKCIEVFKVKYLGEYHSNLSSIEEAELSTLLGHNQNKKFNVEYPGFIRLTGRDNKKLEEKLNALEVGPIDWIESMDHGNQVAQRLGLAPLRKL